MSWRSLPVSLISAYWSSCVASSGSSTGRSGFGPAAAGSASAAVPAPAGSTATAVPGSCATAVPGSTATAVPGSMATAVPRPVGPSGDGAPGPPGPPGPPPVGPAAALAAFEHSEGRGTPEESITCDHDQQAGPGPRPLHGVFARIEPARRGTTLWSSDSKGIVCHTISPQNELELACRAARESLR